MTLAAARLSLAFRLALRELRGGLRGFYIFLACIALGTGAIAAVNSVSHSITDAISTQGQSLLAGDVRFEINNRQATADELSYLKGLGTVSASTGLRSMARLPDGSDQALVEVKSVDQAYPLYGTFEAEPQQPLASLLSEQGGSYGAVVAPLLLERLHLGIGSQLLLGNARLRITGTVKNEPDAISEGFGFAPRLLTSNEALAASGLIQTGSLVQNAYKIRMDNPTVAIKDIADRSNKAFPSAGWSIRTSEKAAPSLADNITRFSQFLTLVGLTALIVGGVGVANAVRAFLDAKRTTIATFKCRPSSW
jgi:putative ABC transport system permease protein